MDSIDTLCLSCRRAFRSVSWSNRLGVARNKTIFCFKCATLRGVCQCCTKKLPLSETQTLRSKNLVRRVEKLTEVRDATQFDYSYNILLKQLEVDKDKYQDLIRFAIELEELDRNATGTAKVAAAPLRVHDAAKCAEEIESLREQYYSKYAEADENDPLRRILQTVCGSESSTQNIRLDQIEPINPFP